MSIARDLADILALDAVGTVGTDIYVGKLPDQDDAPHKCLAVIESGAIFMSPKWQRDELTIQFLIRGPQRDYETAQDFAYDVMRALNGRDRVTVNSNTYCLFAPIGGVNYLTTDQRDRAIFSINFKVVMDNSVEYAGNRQSF